MDRPRVIIHNVMSLDGRLDGFPVDVGLYYELASRLPHQAVLTGSATMLAAAASQGIDMGVEDPPPAPRPPAAGAAAAAGDGRPILVIIDGRGRLTRHAWLREQPFWRDVVVLCCSATPAAQLVRLRLRRVEHLVLGEARVDLSAALRALAERYQVSAVRVDAGGALNGALLQAGLVDEMSVVIAPYLAASATAHPARLAAGLGRPGTVTLEPAAVRAAAPGARLAAVHTARQPVPRLTMALRHLGSWTRLQAPIRWPSRHRPWVPDPGAVQPACAAGRRTRRRLCGHRLRSGLGHHAGLARLACPPP